MAGNSVKLEFAGDASKLAKASKQAEQSIAGVGKSATSASDDLAKASKSSTDFTDRIGKLGAGVSGATDAIGAAGDAVQALADLQQAGAERASRLARAATDVQQATEDMAQATRDASQAQIDSRQAGLDLEQAQLDQATALRDYNAAVKEHGARSAEARQAQIDLKQAGIDVQQAQEDTAQATRDLSQANIDAQSAQLDLNDAQREASPPDSQKWADQISMITPLLSGLVGVVGLVTAAQWAFNAAQLASPTTWIIVGIVALIAVIVLIATKTDWFSKAWRASWAWIKDAAANTWEFLKKIPGWIGTAFKAVANAITWPFRTAFNFIADAWNHTIGALSWTVPGWIPGIGGSSINVPDIPKFHQGGTVPGAPGSEVLAVLQAGETVTSRAGSAGGGDLVLKSGASDARVIDLLLNLVAEGVRDRGGDVQLVLGGAR